MGDMADYYRDLELEHSMDFGMNYDDDTIDEDMLEFGMLDRENRDPFTHDRKSKRKTRDDRFNPNTPVVHVSEDRRKFSIKRNAPVPLLPTMEDGHLVNTIRMIMRHIRKEFDDISNGRDYYDIRIYEEEAILRGLDFSDPEVVLTL